MTSYKLLIKRGGQMTLYKVYSTLDEAQQKMADLNGQYLNKAWKRANSRGHRQIGHQAYYDALSRTAIQY